MNVRRTAAMSVKAGRRRRLHAFGREAGQPRQASACSSRLRSTGKNTDELTGARQGHRHARRRLPARCRSISRSLPKEFLERETAILDREERRQEAGSAGEDLPVEPEEPRQGALPARPAVCARQLQDRRARRSRIAEGKVGGPITCTGFVRYQLGEGIEHKKEDFAEEVRKAAGH